MNQRYRDCGEKDGEMGHESKSRFSILSKVKNEGMERESLWYMRTNNQFCVKLFHCVADSGSRSRNQERNE